MPVISDAWLKPAVAVLLGLPLAWLAYAIVQEIGQPGSALGADPGEAVVLFLGVWGLRWLLLALAVSPLRRRLHWPALARVRRMIGLYAYAYLVAHFTAYLALLAGFDWRTIAEDLVERTYITAGVLALVLLTPLAITSTRGWQRRLRRNWQRLHRLVYPAAALGLLHLIWLTKDGYGEVLVYAVVFVLLMAERLATRSKLHGSTGKASV